MKKYLLIGILLIAAFLRLWRLDEVPVSLFGDELDVGYHAYSILKTGRDYYGNFLPLHFHSLAEWRTPLYLYSVVPTVALFGISPLGVRLPAAIFGILGVWALYLLIKQITNNRSLAILSALSIAISPWHIQYSRAAFEVTQMLFFFLFGLYLFLKSIGQKGKWLWFSVVCFLLMPWGYSTAKLFTPFFILLLFTLFYKTIINLPKKQLLYSIIAGLILGLPLIYSILAGGGSQRFGYISIFTDPTTESEIGSIRQQLARYRGETGTGLQPTFNDRLFHNKFTLWGDVLLNNYFQAFSTDFLFIRGDLNLRHSIDGQGMLYKIEAITLVLGIVFFFTSKVNRKIKILLALWILGGVIPSAITREGGTHATRLILILPPLLFLISYGIIALPSLVHKKLGYLLLATYYILLATCFVVYQHNYWTVNPWNSERWWHTGWRDAVQSIKAMDKDYSRVIVSTADEPPWVFFAGWYQYPPQDWQNNFPIGNDVEVEGIGKVSHIDKFYFGSPEGGLYDWGKVLTADDLYLASAKEVNVNLINEPERTPHDLKLLKSIAYPSGEPAFYIFSGRNEN